MPRGVLTWLAAAAAVLAFSCGAAAEVPSLTPGPGWRGGWVATPPAQGTPSERGYDEQPSAKFDVVPYQLVKELNACVIAGKGPTQAQYDAGVRNAIAKVSFSDDDGPWVDVSAPSPNPASGVVEYCAAVQGSDHADGPHEVRAIVYPMTGVPRVLQGEKDAQPAASFTGRITGSALTLEGPPSAGVLQPGASLSGLWIYDGTVVTSQSDATHYTLSQDYGSQGVPSEPMTGAYDRADRAYGLIFVTNAKGSVATQSVYVAPADDPIAPGADTETCGSETSPCASLLQARQRLKALAGGKTPEVGGSHIWLAPNTAAAPSYAWPNAPNDNGLAARWAWVDIGRWPGRTGTVRLSGGMGKGGPRIEKVRLGQVTVMADPADQGGNDGPRPGAASIQRRDAALFCDGSSFVGQGPQPPNHANFPFRPTRWRGGTFARNCDIGKYTNGPLGSTLVQGGHIHDILADAVTYSPMVVNTLVTDLLSGKGAHPDVAQYSGDLYQLEAQVRIDKGVLHVERAGKGDVADIRPGLALFAQQQTDLGLPGGSWITRQLPTEAGDLATFELNDEGLTRPSSYVMFLTPRRNVILWGLRTGRQSGGERAANINGQCAYPNQNANFDFLFANVQIDNSINAGRTCVSANGYIENFFQLNNEWKGGPNRFRDNDFNFKYAGRNNTIVDSRCNGQPFALPPDGSVLGLQAKGAGDCAAAR
jgi:hypothetical protein